MYKRSCAIICAHNEEKTIFDIASRAKKYVDAVLVVDDGSTDNTSREAIISGASVIPHGYNRGKGAALRTGFDFCLSQNYDLIAALDADGQHPPEYLPSFLSRLDFYSAVIGRRNFSVPEVPWMRRLGNRLDSMILSDILGVEIPDPQNGFRAFKKEVLERTLAGCSGNSGFTFEIEMLVRMIRNKENLMWLPIQTIYSPKIKSHQRPLKHIRDSMSLYLSAFMGRI
jgi:glycosyltransferase involved in cell wall biosynthesis